MSKILWMCPTLQLMSAASCSISVQPKEEFGSIFSTTSHCRLQQDPPEAFPSPPESFPSHILRSPGLGSALKVCLTSAEQKERTIPLLSNVPPEAVGLICCQSSLPPPGHLNLFSAEILPSCSMTTSWCVGLFLPSDGLCIHLCSTS